MMKTTDGFAYAFNAQAVVDEEAQVIVAHSVTNQATDVQQLVEMIEATEANLGAAGIDKNPDTFITDAGYFSEKNVNDATDAGVDVLIATGRISTTNGCQTHREVPSQKTPPSKRRWHADCAPRRDGPITPDARPSSSRSSARRRSDKALASSVCAASKVPKVSGPCTGSATTCESWPGQPHRKARKASLRHRPLTQRACRPPVPRHCLSGVPDTVQRRRPSHWSIPTHAPSSAAGPKGGSWNSAESEGVGPASFLPQLDAPQTALSGWSTGRRRRI